MELSTTKAEFKDYCIQNKYTNWYFSIVETAIIRNWTRKTATCYVKSHHALPKCIFENEDTVFLIAKEEYYNVSSY